MQNKDPKWNEGGVWVGRIDGVAAGCYCLKFKGKGRVLIASAKNFMLVGPEDGACMAAAYFLLTLGREPRLSSVRQAD